MNALDWARVYARMSKVVGSRLITSRAREIGLPGDDAGKIGRRILTSNRVSKELMGWTTAADGCWPEAGS